jgi:hypothetical protein
VTLAELALKHVCPACRAGAGEKCLKRSSTNNYWDLHRMKTIHPARLDLARADVRDQGKADW